MKYHKGSFVIVPNKNILKGESASVRSVYLSICGFADDEGQCFPSISKIASEAGVSENTTREAITRLTEIKLLSKQERPQSGNRNLTNLYLLLVGEGAMVEEVGATTEPTSLQNKGVELYPIRTISTYLSADAEELRIESETSKPVRQKKTTADVEAVFAVFDDNPARKLWKVRPIEREAAQLLFDSVGLETIKHNYNLVKKHRNDPMCPQINKPSDLLEKGVNMEKFLQNL